MKSIAIAAALAVVPSALGAEPYLDTVDTISVPRTVFQHIYVHATTTVDIGLPDGERLAYTPVVGDPRWRVKPYISGDTQHIILKATDSLPTLQLLTIPGVRHPYHLVVSSGILQSTTYSVNFYEPMSPRPTPKAFARPVAYHAPVSKPTPAPPVTVIANCAPPMDSGYRWGGETRDGKPDGDNSIDIRQVCDDGGLPVRHTWFIMQPGRIASGAVLYKVPDGRTDTITNPNFTAAHGPYPDQWIVDGAANQWAFVVDTSSGHLRKVIERNGKR